MRSYLALCAILLASTADSFIVVTPSTPRKSNLFAEKIEKNGISQSARDFAVAAAFVATLMLSPGPSFADGKTEKFKLPPIDYSDKNRCVLSSSSMGQANAARDKLYDLRLCQLSGANAQGYDLSGVIMTSTDVSKANFRDAYFSKGYLRDSNFEGADFSNAIVDRANFQGSSLRGTIFKNTVLTATSFEGADVENADFTESYLGDFDIRSLCRNPTLKGENPVTGVDTRMSVGYYYSTFQQTKMRQCLKFVCAIALVTSSLAFVPQLPPPPQQSNQGISRSTFVTGFVAGIGSAVLVPPSTARADVYSGNELPQGAAQFNRVIRLKRDLISIRKRVAEGAAEMDKKEWENIGQFLRSVYSRGDDMKAVASGIQTPSKKAQAMDDIEQLKKYAQAADIPVSNQNAEGFLTVADKMIALVKDYFDALIDVPDEL